MDDDRIWGSEERLWTGDAENYRRTIDETCLMVLPAPPYVTEGARAIEQVAGTPRWQQVMLADRKVSRPQEGLIVIAYTATASRHGTHDYVAHCTTTYRMIEHGTWRVVQHQQTPPLVSPA